MSNPLHHRVFSVLADELSRHGSDDELRALAAERLAGNPVLVSCLEDHLRECLLCRARFAMLAPAPHWFAAGKVWLRSVPIEAGIADDGSAFLHGASAFVLPAQITIALDVHALSRSPLLYELRVATQSRSRVYLSLTHAHNSGLSTTQLPAVDLSRERSVHCARLAFTTRLQLEPGCWHMGFSPRRAGEPWSVVPLVLHGDI